MSTKLYQILNTEETHDFQEKNTCLLSRLLVLISSPGLLLQTPVTGQTKDEITTARIEAAEHLMGMHFSPAQRDSMLKDLQNNLKSYRSLCTIRLENSVAPVLLFNPLPENFSFSQTQQPLKWSSVTEVRVPADSEKLAFYSVRELAELIRTRQITSTRLTKIYLNRLKKYGPKLHCVITLTEDLALQKAARADREIAAGKYRGLLHGIPYGARDLLAVAKAYQDATGFHLKHPPLFE